MPDGHGNGAPIEKKPFILFRVLNVFGWSCWRPAYFELRETGETTTFREADGATGVADIMDY